MVSRYPQCLRLRTDSGDAVVDAARGGEVGRSGTREWVGPCSASVVVAASACSRGPFGCSWSGGRRPGTGRAHRLWGGPSPGGLARAAGGDRGAGRFRRCARRGRDVGSDPVRGLRAGDGRGGVGGLRGVATVGGGGRVPLGRRG